jgi:hypothetical protein
MNIALWLAQAVLAVAILVRVLDVRLPVKLRRLLTA